MPLTRPFLLLATAALVVSPVLTLPTLAATAGTGPGAAGGAGASGAGAEGCADPLFEEPVRAVTARSAAPKRFAAAVQRNGDNAADVRVASRADATMWLDVCGRALYRDQAVADSERSAGSTGSTGSTGAARVDPRVPAGTDVFRLSSRPGAARTIHLDFDGEAVSGTAWNEGVGDFTAAPYSIDGDTSSFSANERLQVYKTWLTVAEDYAPFDVDVTTADPGDAAITRSDRTDEVYGTRVVVSEAPEVSDGCGCGGVAYLDVFDLAGPAHGFFQPAWVLTPGSGTDGWDMGEVASHEAGHNLSLSHDGIGNRDYYSGAGDWAPIMGASFGTPLAQWSRGEYAGSTTTEDDVALIAASGAPYVVDDHGDTAAQGRPLARGGAVSGVIGTRGDVDAFALTGLGRSTVTVAPAAHSSNLDVRLTILDAAGATVAVVDPKAPASGSTSQPSPGWLGATWTGTVPAGGGWTALVDGVGAGDPRVAGGYSDYGSLGRYRIGLAGDGADEQPTPTGPPSNPPSNPPGNPPTDPGTGGTGATTLAFRTAARLPVARVDRAYRRVIVIAGDSDPTVRWTAGRMPGGMSLAQAGDEVIVSGTPRRAGRTWFRLRVSSADGQTVTRTFRLRVLR